MDRPAQTQTNNPDRAPVRSLLGRLSAVLADISELGVDALADSDTIELASGLATSVDRATALLGTTLASGQTRLVNNRHGHRTMENVIAATLPMSASKLRYTRTIGTWLIDFPVLAHAYQTGMLTTAQIHTLHDAHNPRVHHAMREFQHDFITHADGLTHPEFKQAVANWLLITDPDGPTPSETELANRYGVKIERQPNGDIKIVALLDPIAGQAATTAIENATKALHDAHNNDAHDNAEAADSNESTRAGYVAAPALSWRTLRMHAFMMLIARGHTRTDGRRHPAR